MGGMLQAIHQNQFRLPLINSGKGTIEKGAIKSLIEGLASYRQLFLENFMKLLADSPGQDLDQLKILLEHMKLRIVQPTVPTANPVANMPLIRGMVARTVDQESIQEIMQLSFNQPPRTDDTKEVSAKTRKGGYLSSYIAIKDFNPFIPLSSCYRDWETDRKSGV